MDWFVVAVFIVFIGGLVWVAVEAIRHANKRQFDITYTRIGSWLDGCTRMLSEGFLS